MQTEAEARRVRAVYREYMPRVSGRWRPENRGNRAILAELEGNLAALLRSRGLVPLGGRTALDVGCGYGHFLGVLASLGARREDVHGIDLVEERVAHARSAQPGVDVRVSNAEEIPHPDGAFDVVLLFSVLTSILDAGMRMHVAREVARVLRSGGVIVWYDFRFDHPTNPNVRGIGRREVERLFPGFDANLRTTTLVPPIARRLGPLTPALYPALASIPALRSHYLGTLERGTAAP